jgi:release factor glutamine methyltransferase
MISAGAIRRFLHPLLLRLWLKHVRERERVTHIDGFTLKVFPSVFHPRFFGSSVAFARALTAIGLEGRKFLDVGTGSGIVALFASRAGAEVTAVDINPEAVRCARENAANAGLSIDCRLSDLFSSLPEAKFDVIAWNPPFFPGAPTTAAEAALYAGPDHEVVRRFAGEVGSRLTPGGRIFLILSMDLDLETWNRIFSGRLVERSRVRWGWETMGIYEVTPDLVQ